MELAARLAALQTWNVTLNSSINRNSTVTLKRLAAALSSIAVLTLYPAIVFATQFSGEDCHTNGNACADEGQAYLAVYKRAEEYRAYSDRLAAGYGHATRFKLCGPYHGTMGGYPYNYEPKIVMAVRATETPCDATQGAVYSAFNYYGGADRCTERPPIASMVQVPIGQMQCTNGCAYSFSAATNGSVTAQPTGNVCSGAPFDGDKNNKCD